MAHLLKQQVSLFPPSEPVQGSTAFHRIEWVDRQHPARADLQEFIAASFAQIYGATIGSFCDTLVGCRDQHGQWSAALGFSFAADGPLFLEHYLDVPVESAIAARLGAAVARSRIAEVGNLAALRAGAARALIVCMTEYLHRQGQTWVTFTATRSLVNSFSRLRLKPVVLAPADPCRLPDGGKNWGSYYATQPQVMFGNIQSGHAQLAS